MLLSGDQLFVQLKYGFLKSKRKFLIMKFVTRKLWTTQSLIVDDHWRVDEGRFICKIVGFWIERQNDQEKWYLQKHVESFSEHMVNHSEGIDQLYGSVQVKENEFHPIEWYY